MKTSSIFVSNRTAILCARQIEGLYFPLSREIIVCLDTFVNDISYCTNISAKVIYSVRIMHLIIKQKRTVVFTTVRMVSLLSEQVLLCFLIKDVHKLRSECIAYSLVASVY